MPAEPNIDAVVWGLFVELTKVIVVLPNVMELVVLKRMCGFMIEALIIA